MRSQREEYEEWLATRPATVRNLARRFVPGMLIDVDGVTHWVIGYHEEEGDKCGLIISSINPRERYQEAVAKKKYICSDHLDGIVMPTRRHSDRDVAGDSAG